MRLIDADAITYELWITEVEVDKTRDNGTYHYFQNRFMVDRRDIESMPTVEQWIPCSERLPDKSVLCCDKYGEIMIGYVYKDDVESDTGYSAESDQELMYNCIAWMPLPPSYKGDIK